MNPFEQQKKLFEQWEKNLAQYLESTMRQPEFMKLVGKNLEATLDVQGAVKRQVKQTLKALSIPTDEDLGGLYRTVNDLETKVLDLQEEVEDLQDELKKAREGTVAAPPARKALKRTARKAAKKAVKRTAKKAAKKTARKTAAKTARKTAKKAAKKPAARKPARKTAGAGKKR